MIDREYIKDLVKRYEDITVCVLGSHSALEVMDGAKDEGFNTIIICQKGRELPYRRFSRLADDIIVLDDFKSVLSKDIQDTLISKNSVMIPHRALTAYLGYDAVESMLRIPIFGNRAMLRIEDRSAHNTRNQYYLLEKAGIRHPRIIKSARDIDTQVIVKVQEAKRKLERAFFIAGSYEEYVKKAEERIRKGIIDREDLESAVIEEYVVGTYFNFNYFYSPLRDEVEFLGIERRLQTNIHDFTSIPAREQLEMNSNIELQNVEIGHTPASIRESMLEKIFEIGDRFANTSKQEFPPGIIGAFSLQSVVTKDLEIMVYDVSPRVPGNPILATTSPYTKYMYGEVFGVGRRIAKELRDALSAGMLDRVLT